MLAACECLRRGHSGYLPRAIYMSSKTFNLPLSLGPFMTSILPRAGTDDFEGLIQLDLREAFTHKWSTERQSLRKIYALTDPEGQVPAKKVRKVQNPYGTVEIHIDFHGTSLANAGKGAAGILTNAFNKTTSDGKSPRDAVVPTPRNVSVIQTHQSTPVFNQAPGSLEREVELAVTILQLLGRDVCILRSRWQRYKSRAWRRIYQLSRCAWSAVTARS